jgi:hypothetical protein
VLLGLGHNDTEDTVLKAGRDGILVDACGKVEAARELANAALSKPVLGLVGWLLGLLVLLDDLLEARLVGLRLGLVFDCGLVAGAVLALALSDGSSGGVTLDGTAGWCAGSVGALDLAANEHGLRLCELDLNVLLVYARELAVELVGFTGLADIKLGLPVLKTGAATLASSSALTGVVVEVIEKAEERVEGGVVRGVVEVAREESHCADLVGSRLESDVLQVAWESSRKASFARLHEEAFALLSLFCLFSEMERGPGIMGKMP